MKSKTKVKESLTTAMKLQRVEEDIEDLANHFEELGLQVLADILDEAMTRVEDVKDTIAFI